MRLVTQGNYGYALDNKGEITWMWISDARYKQAHQGLRAELEAFLAMEDGKRGGLRGYSEACLTLRAMESSGAYSFVRNSAFKDEGGYFLVADNARVTAYSQANPDQSDHPPKWWQFWKRRSQSGA